MNEWHEVGHMGGMWLWWILALALIVLAVWVISRTMSGSDGSSGETPEQRLKRRYADGEIDKEEYETRLKDLRR